MFMYYQKSFLKLSLFSIFALVIKVNAKSIDTNTENNGNAPIIKLPVIISIIGVVAVVAAGGFCLFSSKKSKRLSEECLTKPENNQFTPSTSPSSSNSEVRVVKNEVEETDISIKIDNMNNEVKNDLNTEQQNTEENDELNNTEKEPQKKRKSLLDALLARTSKKEKRSSNIQFIEERSLNSISTNEDWINEQKYQADLQVQEGKSPDNIYEDEEVNSNDGFWNSDLEPIQSSANNNKKESYAVPSLGSRNSVIIKGTEQNQTMKHQSVIIVNDENGSKTNRSSVGSSNTEDLKPTRVKSWRNNDFNKEIMEMIKNLDENEQIKEEIEYKLDNKH